LLIEKEISLVEALTGFEFISTHLDGKKIRIRNKAGEVIKPDDIKTVEGHGMPYHKQTFKSGNLFIMFKIKFPESLNTTQIHKVGGALAFQKKKADVEMDIAETCSLQEFKEQHRNTHHEGGTQGNNSDGEEEDDGQGNGTKVRCNQQ
jgi:DnaJ family protein A protein 2